jgi:hypothetical protein
MNRRKSVLYVKAESRVHAYWDELTSPRDVPSSYKVIWLSGLSPARAGDDETVLCACCWTDVAQDLVVRYLLLAVDPVVELEPMMASWVAQRRCEIRQADDAPSRRSQREDRKASSSSPPSLSTAVRAPLRRRHRQSAVLRFAHVGSTFMR